MEYVMLQGYLAEGLLTLADNHAISGKRICTVCSIHVGNLRVIDGQTALLDGAAWRMQPWQHSLPFLPLPCHEPWL